MQFSNDAKQLKYEVLKRVAELAFHNQLEQKKDQIPYDIIPTNQAKFRCCVYKEREIIRERVTIATKGNYDEHIVRVLPAACEGCPINRYTVTANCQKCLAKKCVSACPFGAVSMSGTGAYIDPAKCKECGRCAKACPYNAISDTMRPCLRACPVNAISMDENKQALIDYDRCISCGHCTSDCPFGAISDSSSMVDVIKEIQSGKRVVAVFAPAIEGQFGTSTIGMIKGALAEVGFSDSVEVALGADAVAAHEAEELEEAVERGSKLTTSCCPAFVSMIMKHFPQLWPNVSHTVSPMTATVRYLKDYDPNTVAVFIGPCVAKKAEAQRVKGSADYVLTFEEIAAMFDAKGADPKRHTEESQDGSVYGKKFAQSGGVSGAVMRALDERGVTLPVSCLKCNGAAECKKALSILKAGKLPENMIEGMACEGGCIAGPAHLVETRVAIQNRNKLIPNADDRGILENVEQHDFSKIDMNRT